MAIKLVTSTEPYSSQRVSLGGTLFHLELKYAARTQSWHLDIYLADKTSPVLLGLKVVPNQNLTGRYEVPILSSGDLFCLRIKNTQEPVGLENFGPEKDYALFWLTDSEKDDLGLTEFINNP